jgi:hypothetical protein
MPYLLRSVKVSLVMFAGSGVWLVATRADANGHLLESLIYGTLAVSHGTLAVSHANMVRHAKMVQCVAHADPTTAIAVHQCHIVATVGYGIMAVLKGISAFTGN